MKKFFWLAMIPALLSGCGLLDIGEGITVTLPPVEYAFDLNANVARNQLEAALEDALGLPVDLTGQTQIPTKLPPGCTGSPPACNTVPRIQETLHFDLPAQQVDIKSMDEQEDLQNAIEAGKVKAVNIDYIEYEITDNSLNFNLPEVVLYVDDLAVTSIQTGSDKVARIDAIEAGYEGLDRVQFTVDGREKMSDRLLQDFAFSFLGQGALEFDTNVTRSIPGGLLSGVVRVQLSFKVDAL